MVIFRRIVVQLSKRSVLHSYRSYSAICCQADRNKFNHQQNTILSRDLNRILSKSKANIYFTVSKQRFSIAEFTKWQEQTYTSISNSYLVTSVQDGILAFHEFTGLPWWATIITSTILIRSAVTLPLAIQQYSVLAKVENISIEFKELLDELKKETAIAKKAYNLTDKQAMILFKKSYKKQWNKLIVRDNCHPLKASLLMLLQIPIWVCMSFALRNLVQMRPIADANALLIFTQLGLGGFGWIPNLTQPDSTLILPIAFGLINLAIIEIQRMSKIRKPSRMYDIFTNIFRGFSLVMIPVAANVPSCMCLYWITSSGFGLVQNLVLLSPVVRRKLGIPEAPSEIEQPYEHIRNEISFQFQKFLPKKTE